MPFAKVNGITMYYEVHGKGEPVVLIGGLGSQTQSWATQVPLYSRHFKVVVLDNRGAGKTDKPDEPYSIEQMADDTAALIEHLGIESARVAGKSMGGMIGQWLAIKHPEKVSKLVLGCTCASRDEVGDEILRLGRETAAKLGFGSVWMCALFWGYTREYIERNLSSIKNAMSMIRESPEAVAGYLRQNRACQRHDTSELVGGISCPTLIMLGERDLIVAPRRSRELSRLIPGSRLVEFEGVGHGFWREKQSEVDDIVLDFLLG
ncbi:MAG: alpha/beta fold hydrolase [Candidatus Dadabacteria bacterium]|nr:alpha/beta fold hydrolase [Candidatus Dadabacteria bacterium]